MQLADYTNSNEECVFRYKHDLKSKKTIFVGMYGLFSVINIIKTESSNFLSNHTSHNHGPQIDMIITVILGNYN